jgi:hypothetical protein
MSWFETVSAWSRVLPLMISVRAEEEAIALVQPKVWKRESRMVSGGFLNLQMQPQGIPAGDAADFAVHHRHISFLGIGDRPLVNGVVEQFKYFFGIVPHGGFGG